MSTTKSGWKDQIQTFGRSLLLPIALLAPIGMVMGICSAMGQSYMIDPVNYTGLCSVIAEEMAEKAARKAAGLKIVLLE